MWKVKRGVVAMKVVKMLKYLVVVSALGMMVIPGKSFGYSVTEAEDLTRSTRETWIRDGAVTDAHTAALQHVVEELKARPKDSLNEIQRIELDIVIAKKEIQLEKKKLEKLASDKTYYLKLNSIKESTEDYDYVSRDVSTILGGVASARVVDGEDITLRHRIQELLVSQRERELGILESRKRELVARVGIEEGLKHNVKEKSDSIKILCDLIDSLTGSLNKVEELNHKMHFVYGLVDGKPLPQALGEASQFRLQFAHEQAQSFYEQAQALYKEAKEEKDEDKLKAAIHLKQLGDQAMMAIYMQQSGGMSGGGFPQFPGAITGTPTMHPSVMGGMSQMQQGSLANMLPMLMQGGGIGGMQMQGMPGMGGMNPAMSMMYNPYQTGNQYDFSVGGPVGDGYFPGQFGADFSNNGMGGGNINLMYAPENKQLNNVMDRYIDQNPQQYPYGYPGYMQNFNSGMFGG